MLLSIESSINKIFNDWHKIPTKILDTIASGLATLVTRSCALFELKSCALD